MKLRNSLVLVFVAMLFAACGSKYFMLKEAYAPVKKVALVQWAINPHLLMGTAAQDDARSGTADKVWETYGKLMANNYQVMPFAEMSANAAYTGAGGKAAAEGYYTAKGAMFFSPDNDGLEAGTISADAAKKLCEGLGVDGVVVGYESWGTAPQGFGFTSHARNAYVLNMFDKSGVKVWGDVVWGESKGDGFPSPAGIIGGDVAIYVGANNEAMTEALAEANTHLGK